MTQFKITIKSQGQKRVEEAEGIKDLNRQLALYRSQGWTITKIKRVSPVQPTWAALEGLLV
jgi:hypothetical protein